MNASFIDGLLGLSFLLSVERATVWIFTSELI